MKQRLGIARALVNDPAVVFLDEPSLGLDPAGQREVLRLVDGIARERGATVVLSTHFLAEVEDACSRALILNRGRVVADGTVAEITRRAAAPRSGRVCVQPDLRPLALEALQGAGGLSAVQALADQPGWMTVQMAVDGAVDARAEFADACGSDRRRTSPRWRSSSRARGCSDAFLSMTEAA